VIFLCTETIVIFVKGVKSAFRICIGSPLFRQTDGETPSSLLRVVRILAGSASFLKENIPFHDYPMVKTMG
jgi:hypothetical protein